MRKRSQVVAEQAPLSAAAPSAGASTTAHLDHPRGPSSTIKSDRVPGNVELFRGQVHVKCLECGMKNNEISAKRVDGKLTCQRCKTDLDPDNVLTEAYVEELRKLAKDAPGDPKSTDDGIDRCAQCGKALTITSAGKFYPCGHKQTELPGVASPTPPAAGGVVGSVNAVEIDPVAAMQRDDSKKLKGSAVRREDPIEVSTVNNVNLNMNTDVVHATYGKELFSPVKYNTFEVGPFEGSTALRDGETHEQATARVYEGLKAFARIEFERKAKEFAERLESMHVTNDR